MEAKRVEPKPVAMVVGIVLLVLGPLVGVATGICTMFAVWSQVGLAPPAARASMLSDGMGDAFTYGLLGGGSLVILGVLLTVRGVVRRRRA